MKRVPKVDATKDAAMVADALKCPDAFAAIIERFEKPIISFIISTSGVSKADAEDIAQQTFIKAYVHLESFEREHKLSTWLFGIAHRESISAWRKAAARPKQVADETIIDFFESVAQDIGEEIDTKQRAKKVHAVLQVLSPKERTVLRLYYMDALSYDDIADILKCPRGTVSTLLHRAKKAFKSAARNYHFYD